MANLVLYGVSASGKSTLLDMVNRDDSVSIHRKDSTRSPRYYESDEQKDLRFITDEEFDHNERTGSYVATYSIYDNKYGIVRSQLEEAAVICSSHFIIVRDIPVIRQLKEGYDASVIYLHSDDQQIYSRLLQRGDSDVKKRLKSLRNDYQIFAENNTLFDYFILNFDSMDIAYRQLKNIIDSQKNMAALKN